MSLVKKCTNPKCGWEYPAVSYLQDICRFCKYPLDTRYCKACNRVLPLSAFANPVPIRYAYNGLRRVGSHCVECNKSRARAYVKANRQRFRDRRRAKRDQEFRDWLDTTIPLNRPMKESEWLQACSYFGGCALCGEEYIETRQFFINRKSGGGYTPWNVFPCCERCALIYRQNQVNPFIWSDVDLGKMGLKKDFIKRENFFRMLDYFKEQINEEVKRNGHE